MAIVTTAKSPLCYEVGPRPDLTGGGGTKVTTHTVSTAACLMLLSTAPAMAVDCTAIRAACVKCCQNSRACPAAGLREPMFLFVPPTNALVGRVFVMRTLGLFGVPRSAPVPMLASHRSPNSATIQAQASCTTSCRTKFKVRSAQRQCEIGSITAITCEEGTGLN